MSRLTLEIGVCCAVCPDRTVRTVLLAVILARVTVAAAVDKHADSYKVAHFELLDGCANLGNSTDDLVARHNGERLGAPVTVHGVDVGVADALKLDIDANVFRADIAAEDGVRAKLGSGVKCGIGACGVAHVPSVRVAESSARLLTPPFSGKRKAGAESVPRLFSCSVSLASNSRATRSSRERE